MDIHISASDVVRLLIAIIAAAVFVTKLIDGLQKAGAVKDNQAHNWNQALGFVIALSGFLLKYLGVGESGALDSQALGLELAGVLITGFSIALVAKLLHELVKWMEGHKALTDFLGR